MVLGEELGRGAMGIVRSGQQRSLGREVAVKAPLDETNGPPDAGNVDAPRQGQSPSTSTPHIASPDSEASGHAYAPFRNQSWSSEHIPASGDGSATG